ncbi:MAG: L-threonylcarbamoyladenylate synthase [Candidatus Thermoplasmatota archaeon]
MMEFKCEKKECDGECAAYMISTINEVLSNGELIVYPTETLYGIGGDPYKEGMMDKIRGVKEAPQDKKISIAYSDMDQASEFIDEDLPESAWALEEKLLPGPLCIVVETEDGSEGIRVPDHPLPQKIVQDFGPITSTSANVHGRPAPMEIKTSKIQLDGRVKLYVNCGSCELGRGSTVVKLKDDGFEMLRGGPISKEEIGDALGV